LNPVLIKYISGQNVVYTKKAGHAKHIVVGSIIHYADDKSTVWGAGLISEKHKPKGNPLIRAVRGPLTRSRLISMGMMCPEIYGDPALLYPRYYKPEIEKKHEIGIIPHYKDKNDPWVLKQDAKIIDIQGDINKVVDEVCSCKTIISSSLHGVIMADAYGIPGYWVKISDKLVGGNFKFKDYFASVKRDPNPIIVSENMTIKDVQNQFYDYKISIDLDRLMSACPFKSQ